jgi:hypothetical protein
VALTLAVGLGLTFIGLAYHHHKRHLELFHRSQLPGDRASA